MSSAATISLKRVDNNGGGYSPDNACFPDLGSSLAIISVNLDDQSLSLQSLSQVLSPQEQNRADRYVKHVDRQRFMMRRALLKMLIARFLGVEPVQITIIQAGQDRPYIKADINHKGLCYSMSSANGMALYGFTLNRAVGIDLEYHKRTNDCSSLAEHYFTVAEAAFIRQLEGQEQMEAFLDCWTRKEAYIKAAGVRPLDSFDTGLKTGRIDDYAFPENNGRWTLLSPQVNRDYRSSLVYEDPDSQPLAVLQYQIY